MELRWIRGPATKDWPLSFHLQYRLFNEDMSSCWTSWIDVPSVESPKETSPVQRKLCCADDLNAPIHFKEDCSKPETKEWCEHIKEGADHPYSTTLYYPDGSYRNFCKYDLFCPVCGTPRPMPKKPDKFSMYPCKHPEHANADLCVGLSKLYDAEQSVVRAALKWYDPALADCEYGIKCKKHAGVCQLMYAVRAYMKAGGK